MPFLSPHFHTDEFRCRDGTPAPRACWGMMSMLCTLHLEPLRAEFGTVRVVSGYRTRAWNIQVGGAPHSYHVYNANRHGVAADIRCARGGPQRWAAWLERHTHPGGLGIYGDHIHVDTRASLARW